MQPAARRDAYVRTIDELSQLGEKRAGTTAGERAIEYLRSRFDALDLRAELEPFAFPRHEVARARLDLWDDAGPVRPDVAFNVLEASASGATRGAVVWAANATPEVLAALEIRGAIAVVESNRHYHRSTQVTNLHAAGAAAMIYISSAPGNLRQAGSVRARWEAMAPIPAISIGAEDGARLEARLEDPRPLLGAIDVRAHIDRGVGHNVVARLPGHDPSAGTIVVGAHFDSWYAGACDNAGGVAAMLAIAEAARASARPCNLAFVAFDGEELALYGGYEFLRRRKLVSPETLRAVINLETPAASGTPMCGLAFSRHAVLETALAHARLPELYPLYIGMDAVPQLFGGIIPTDIQGIYREGIPTMSTAVDAPYYHTCDDTPDKVDLDLLDKATTRLVHAIDRLAVAPRGAFAERDPSLWRLWAAPRARHRREPLRYRVQATDGRGIPQAGATVEATLLYDGFHVGAQTRVTTGSDGSAELELDASAVGAAAAFAFVHLAAGRDYPLVELVRAAD